MGLWGLSHWTTREVSGKGLPVSPAHSLEPWHHKGAVGGGIHTSCISHRHPKLRSLTSVPKATVRGPHALCPSLSASFPPSASASLLQGFWCQPAGQLSRDQLAALIRRMATQHVLLRAWQVSSGHRQDCLGVEGSGRLPGEGPQGQAGREASLAGGPGSTRPGLWGQDAG